MKRPPMGSVVLVTSTVRRVRTANYSTPIVSTAKPRPGWVVGYRTIAGAGRVEDLEPGDPRLFEEEPRMSVILVAYWPTMKPVQVPLHGWDETTEEPYFWSAKERESISKDIRKFGQRDEKGRFIS